MRQSRWWSWSHSSQSISAGVPWWSWKRTAGQQRHARWLLCYDNHLSTGTGICISRTYIHTCNENRWTILFYYTTLQI